MAIRYDHLQAAKDAEMITGGLAVGTVRTLPAATYTDYVVYRSYINPGFDGTISWLELNILFAVIGTAVANTLSGKWQIRARGETTWTDLATITSIALTAAYQSSITRVVYDAVAATNTAPWELQLICSTTASTTVAFQFGNGTVGGAFTGTLYTRTVGESV